jgi:hypothetical protein
MATMDTCTRIHNMLLLLQRSHTNQSNHIKSSFIFPSIILHFPAKLIFSEMETMENFKGKIENFTHKKSSVPVLGKA